MAAHTRDTEVNTIQSIAGIAPKDLRIIPSTHTVNAVATQASMTRKQYVSTVRHRITLDQP